MKLPLLVKAALFTLTKIPWSTLDDVFSKTTVEVAKQQGKIGEGVDKARIVLELVTPVVPDKWRNIARYLVQMFIELILILRKS